MAQQHVTLTVHTSPRWWFRPVLMLLLAVHRTSGRAPAPSTIHLPAKHGVRYSVRP